MRLQRSSTVREPQVSSTGCRVLLHSRLTAAELGCSAPPQVSGEVHEPQLIVRSIPHSSVAVSSPHSAEAFEHNSTSLEGLQIHCFFHYLTRMSQNSHRYHKPRFVPYRSDRSWLGVRTPVDSKNKAPLKFLRHKCRRRLSKQSSQTFITVYAVFTLLSWYRRRSLQSGQRGLSKRNNEIVHD